MPQHVPASQGSRTPQTSRLRHMTPNTTSLGSTTPTVVENAPRSELALQPKQPLCLIFRGSCASTLTNVPMRGAVTSRHWGSGAAPGTPLFGSTRHYSAPDETSPMDGEWRFSS